MERCTGRDPSRLELSERSSRRQIGPAHRFIDEKEEIFATTEELPTSTIPISHSSQPPKAKYRLRSVDSQSFRAIFKKAKELKLRISTESLRKSDSNVEEEVKQGTCRYKITISNQVSCKCSSLQITNRRTCHHIVQPLLNICNISQGTQLLAQVDIGRSVLENLILKVPDEIPDSLTTIHIDRTYNYMLINYPPFQRDQMRHFGRKVSESPYFCSGCFHPRCIQNNDLQLYVQDLFLLKQQRVVGTKLSFCLSAGSVNVISRSYNNIRPLGNKSFFLTHNLK